MYNKVFLIGNLTRDPELRYTPSGIPVSRFTVAVNRFRPKGSEGKDEVDFIRVVAWRRLAEICGEFLKKGRPVALEGRLQISSFTGRDGQKVTMAEVIADNMQMLGSRQASVTGNQSTVTSNQPPNDSKELASEDEIPF